MLRWFDRLLELLSRLLNGPMPPDPVTRRARAVTAVRPPSLPPPAPPEPLPDPQAGAAPLTVDRPAQRPPAPQDPLHLAIALLELGQAEKPGKDDNERIREYHSITHAGEAPDEVPWCASFVGWCLERAGVRSTRSKAAKSYLGWGIPMLEPRRGDVAVYRWPSGSYHVALYLEPGSSPGTDRVVGGNQSNKVCIRQYRSASVVAYRRAV